MKPNIILPDFHSHVLPKADHGSDSVEVSLKQLTLAYNAGVRHLFATPHFYPHKHKVADFLARRENAYKALTDGIAEAGMHDKVPEIRLGAEVLVCANLDELPELDALCVYGTKTLLLEMPFSGINEDCIVAAENLVDSGYRVILAHADRYSAKDIDRLLSYGTEIQLNADSFGKLFMPSERKRWIASGKVVAIGSDIHGADEKAYVSFCRAIAKLGDDAERIAEESEKIFRSASVYQFK